MPFRPTVLSSWFLGPVFGALAFACGSAKDSDGSTSEDQYGSRQVTAPPRTSQTTPSPTRSSSPGTTQSPSGGPVSVTPSGSNTSCPAAFDSFRPCGGDLTGSWTFIAECIDDTKIPEYMLHAPCPSATASTKAASDEVATFDGRTQSLSASQAFVTIQATIPKSCFPDQQKARTCSLPPLKGATWTDLGTQCQFTLESAPSSAAKNEPYTIQGTRITIQGAEGPKLYEYCVSGDLLYTRNVTPTASVLDANVTVRRRQR